MFLKEELNDFIILPQDKHVMNKKHNQTLILVVSFVYNPPGEVHRTLLVSFSKPCTTLRFQQKVPFYL